MNTATQTMVGIRVAPVRPVCLPSVTLKQLAPGHFCTKYGINEELSVTVSGRGAVSMKYISPDREVDRVYLFPDDVAQRTVSRLDVNGDEHVLDDIDFARKFPGEDLVSRVNRNVKKQRHLLRTLPDNIQTIIRPYGFLD